MLVPLWFPQLFLGSGCNLRYWIGYIYIYIYIYIKRSARSRLWHKINFISEILQAKFRVFFSLTCCHTEKKAKQVLIFPPFSRMKHSFLWIWNVNSLIQELKSGYRMYFLRYPTRVFTKLNKYIYIYIYIIWWRLSCRIFLHKYLKSIYIYIYVKIWL